MAKQGEDVEQLGGISSIQEFFVAEPSDGFRSLFFGGSQMNQIVTILFPPFAPRIDGRVELQKNQSGTAQEGDLEAGSKGLPFHRAPKIRWIGFQRNGKKRRTGIEPVRG